jgi:PEGA domain.
VAILVTCVSWSAVAGEKEQAKQLFDAGLKLMRMDDFAGATANFERSVALYPTQNSLFNLANCYKAVQRYTDALNVLARLRRQFADKLKPEIKEAADRQEQEIQSLVARLTIRTMPADAKVKIDGREVGTGPTLGPVMLGPGDHQVETSRPGYQDVRRSLQLVSGAEVVETFNLVAELGRLALRSNADGASVLVDGKEVGKTPLASALSLPAGRHVVTVERSGYEPAERSVDVTAGAQQDVEIQLHRQMIALAPAAVPAAQSAPTDLGLAAAVAPVPEAQPRSRAAKIVMWSSLAGAVAAGIVAGVYWKIADNRYQTYQSLNTEYKNHGGQDVRDNRDAVGNELTRDSRIALGCGIGAGALAVTALVAYLIDSSDKGAEHASVSLSGTGLNVSF